MSISSSPEVVNMFGYMANEELSLHIELRLLIKLLLR